MDDLFIRKNKTGILVHIWWCQHISRIASALGTCMCLEGRTRAVSRGQRVAFVARGRCFSPWLCRVPDGFSSAGCLSLVWGPRLSLPPPVSESFSVYSLHFLGTVSLCLKFIIACFLLVGTKFLNIESWWLTNYSFWGWAWRWFYEALGDAQRAVPTGLASVRYLFRVKFCPVATANRVLNLDWN